MFEPIYMKDVLCTIAAGEEDEADFAAELSSVALTPSAATATWKGLTPSSIHKHIATAEWVADLGYAQDWDEPESLSRYLFEREGEEVTMVLRPRAGGAGFSVTVIVTPGAIGGAVDQFAAATVQLPVQGKPTALAAPEPEGP